jgi:RNA polymerase sigma-B factor
MTGGPRSSSSLAVMRARSAELFLLLADESATDVERSHNRDELVRLHLPLVEHFARRFLNRGETFDDLLRWARSD